MSKTYVITGSTSGIGFELVQKLSKNNKVFAGFRNQERFNDARFSNIENIIPFYIDMTDFDSIKNAAEFILSKTEKIDTLVNAAGCVVAGAVEEIPVSEIKYQFEVNAFSHLEFTQKLLPKLKGGKVINISSMASFGVFPFVAPYCASKRALDILFNSMQVEMKNEITVVSIKPGVIATPLWEKSIKNNIERLSKDKKYEKEYEYLQENAKRNETKGLPAKKVVETILKADSSKSPKSSYTVGLDAKVAEIFSHLPQGVINKVLNIGLKLKIK